MPLSLPSAPFIFIRHGETDYNAKGLLTGQTDVPLNQRGQQQAFKAVALIRDKNIKRIVHSPLIRAKQTAEIINHYLNVPLYEYDSLKEHGWGILEGCDKEAASVNCARYSETAPEGGESPKDFQVRAIKAVHAVVDHHNLTLIVAHGGIFRVLVENMGFYNYRAHNGIPVLFKPADNQNAAWHISNLDGSEYQTVT